MKICIDAGHYKGYNPGAVKGYCEGDIVWKITQLQKKYLEEYKNVEVVLTRADITKDLSLSNRGAKAKGCDLFISNHSNASEVETVDRAVIIYPYDNKNNSDVLGKKLGKAITDLMGLKQNYQMYQRVYKGGEYYGVMRSARATGCPRYYIIEHGFHTNKAVCNWLLKEGNLEKLAKAEVEVLADYYKLEKKTVEKPITPPNEHKVPFIVSVICDTLNVRKGAGISYEKVGELKKGDAYTIVEVSPNNWGKLKSGLGWISLGEKYVVKK